MHFLILGSLLLAPGLLARSLPSRYYHGSAERAPTTYGYGSPHRIRPNDTVYGPDGEEMLTLQKSARTNLEADLDKFATLGASNGCTKENMIIRKEWRFLTRKERVAYTDAVTCLTTKPSPYNSTQYSGVKSLFDAFGAVHLLLTPYIHADGLFLPWHRYYLYVYEQALKTECGYTGVSPYWEWGLDASDLDASPLFDGSPYSLGSNGYPIPNRTATFEILQTLPYPQLPGQGVTLNAGTGGGCVHSGPFSNLSIDIGPFGLTSVPAALDPLDFNPRCLQRDLNSDALLGWSTFNWTTWTINTGYNIASFQGKLSGGRPTGNDTFNGWGAHGGGHMAVGGEWGSMTDLYASPQDPSFFVHHGQVDRVWTIWQNLDIESRRNALSGTVTYANVPPSANATVDTLLDMGPLAPKVRVGDVMSTVGVNGSALWGPGLCYYYE